jgi:HSP20 family molecular chaperone IbpA
MMTEDWEEKMLEQMAEMFQKMGMTVDINQLKSMMKQFQSKFEAMGIDPERLAKGDVNFNFDMSEISKMFQSGMPLNDMLSNLGVDVRVDATPAEVDIEEDIGIWSDEILKLPSEDIYLSGWNMSITVDFSTRTDFDEIELALSRGGEVLQVLSDPSEPPLAQIELPHQCDDVVDWSINNGILDITLKLTPQGSAIESKSEDIDDDVEDDLAPVASDVSVDLADDDDDEDDGGIPIF